MTGYAICSNCGRGIAINKNGLLKRHYRAGTKNVCVKSGQSYKRGN